MMKRNLLGTLAALGLLASSPAYAQWTVVDPTNLVQNIQQVRQTVETVQKMSQQVKTAQKQLDSFTGSRGMRNLVTDTSRGYIPKNWRETLDGMGSDGQQVKSMVDGIRRDLGDIGNAKLTFAPERVSTELERSAKYDLAAWGRATTLYNRANDRFTELDHLGDALNNANDMKAVMDLMARLQIETNMLLNELIRMQAEMMATDREKALYQEQRTQNDHARAMTGF